MISSKLEELSRRFPDRSPVVTGASEPRAWELDEIASRVGAAACGGADPRNELLDMLAGSYRSRRMPWDVELPAA